MFVQLKIKTERKLIKNPFYNHEEDSHWEDLTVEDVVKNQVEIEAAPSKESFSTITTEIQSLKVNAVEIEIESMKTDNAVSVEKSKKPRRICAFIKPGNIKIDSDLEGEESIEDKEIEPDDTHFEEKVEAFHETQEVRKIDNPRGLSNAPTITPKETNDDTIASVDEQSQAHKLIFPKLSMILKTKPPDPKSFNCSQRNSHDLAKDDQNFKIRTSGNVSTSNDPLMNSNDEEQVAAQQVNHDENVFRQVDEKENDDKDTNEEQVETGSKDVETGQELPRTSTGRIIRPPKRMNL